VFLFDVVIRFDHYAIFDADPEQVQALWTAFLKRAQLGAAALTPVIETIRKRLEPLYKDLRNSRL
jgi:hypothetical protein